MLRYLLLTLLGLPLLAARASAQQSEEVPAPMAELVPAGTKIIVYLPGLERTFAKARELMGALHPALEGKYRIETAFGRILERTDLIDGMGPLLIAPNLEDEHRHLIVFRATNMEELEASLAGTPHAVRGEYCALFHPGEVEGAPHALTRELPAGDFVCRVDMEGICKEYGSSLDGLRDQAIRSYAEKGPFLAPFVDSAVQGLMDALRASERLDGILALEKPEVRFDFWLSGKPGSILDVGEPARIGWRPLISALPRDHVVRFLVGLDLGALLAHAPLPSGATELSRLALPGGALSCGFESGGIEIALVQRVKDGDRFLRELAEWIGSCAELASESGLAIEECEKERIGELDVCVRRIKVPRRGAPKSDLESGVSVQSAFRARDGHILRMAARGDRFALFLGASPERAHGFLAKALGLPQAGQSGEEQLTEDMEAVLAATGGAPLLAMTMDFRGFFIQATRVARSLLDEEKRAKLPELPEGNPLWIRLHLSSHGRTHRVGISMDGYGLFEFARAFLK